MRGLHPRLLSERGLGPALAALAERALLPVEIVESPAKRLPAAVEAAAYYVVAEALANAGKHSGASLVTVRVATEDETIVVEIVDDGVGGADPAGSGLRGLWTASRRSAACSRSRARPTGAPRSGPSCPRTDPPRRRARIRRKRALRAKLCATLDPGGWSWIGHPSRTSPDW